MIGYSSILVFLDPREIIGAYGTLRGRRRGLRGHQPWLQSYLFDSLLVDMVLDSISGSDCITPELCQVWKIQQLKSHGISVGQAIFYTLVAGPGN